MKKIHLRFLPDPFPTTRERRYQSSRVLGSNLPYHEVGIDSNSMLIEIAIWLMALGGNITDALRIMVRKSSRKKIKRLTWYGFGMFFVLSKKKPYNVWVACCWMPRWALGLWNCGWLGVGVCEDSSKGIGAPLDCNGIMTNTQVNLIYKRKICRLQDTKRLAPQAGMRQWRPKSSGGWCPKSLLQLERGSTRSGG